MDSAQLSEKTKWWNNKIIRVLQQISHCYEWKKSSDIIIISSGMVSMTA